MSAVEFLVRAEAITKPSILCDVGGKLSPTILTMNLLVIVIFAFDTIGKNVLKTESQNFILWCTIFVISWIASTFGLNRYGLLELCNLLTIFKLENNSASYQTFLSALLLIGAHSGGILNSILLLIKQHCDMDLDDEISNIEKNCDLVTFDKSVVNYPNNNNIENETEKNGDINSTKLILTSMKSYGTMHG
ncbi:3530_t:CDS:2 [Cetraspora pellucida]|uniref:3530_t:CDS:1 n=1 Tax=Cetraspora pellucida TaxID=1433469 RepID=A0A9N8ZK62_9GLOM|nr:3530_t:CDS:2 [Cetraspora pellucida]